MLAFRWLLLRLIISCWLLVIENVQNCHGFSTTVATSRASMLLLKSNSRMYQILRNGRLPSSRSSATRSYHQQHGFGRHGNNICSYQCDRRKVKRIQLRSSLTSNGGYHEFNSRNETQITTVQERQIVEKRINNNKNMTGEVEKQEKQSLQLSLPPDEGQQQSSLPTYKRLLFFTATTLVIWWTEPLLSLADTTILGWACARSQSSDAIVQIAALGPATTLYDSVVYLTYFLAIATTNQLASALSRKDWKELQQSTSHILGLAVLLGGIVTAFIFAFGQGLIRNMLTARGGDVVAASSKKLMVLLPLATNYAWIRAAVAPFCVVGFVAQSFCLACLDATTPAIAVAVSSIVNICGDFLLAPIMGIQGAAIATALATVSSCLILLRKVVKTTREWKLLQQEEEEAEKQASTTLLSSSIKPYLSTNNGKIKTTAIKNRNKSTIPFMSLPNGSALIDLFNLAGPIFLVMLCIISAYSFLTIQATQFGLVPLAAHNIMMRLFFFYGCFGDAIGQAAQSFMPSFIGAISNDKQQQQQQQQQSKSQSSRKQFVLFKRLAFITAGIGIFNCFSSSWILKNLGHIFATDTSITTYMANHSKYFGLALLIHPFVLLMEGTILATRDLGFLVRSYTITMALHIGLVFSAGTFCDLWKALFIFQGFRFLQFGQRIFRSWKKQQYNTKRSIAE